jgi:hypothetical protein
MAAIADAEPCQGYAASAEARAAALAAMNWELDKLVLGWTTEGPENTADLAGLLGAIASACENVGKSFVSRLVIQAHLIPNQAALAESVDASLDPIVSALMDTAEVLFGMAKPADEIARLLLGVEQLGELCRTTQRRFGEGAAAQAAASIPVYDTKHARDFGFTVIDQYPALVGNEIKISRESTGPRAGKPSGPLIRFVSTILQRARAAVEADETYAPVVERLGLDPPLETIASWVTTRRRSETGPPPEHS